MNKTFTLTFLLFFLSVVQLSAQTHSLFTSTGSGLWTLPATWDPAVVPSATTATPPTAPSTAPVTVIRIEAGDTVTIESSINFGDVPVIIEVYGILEFNKTTGGVSELILPAGSIIKVASTGDIIATSDTGKAETANFLTIGNTTINGDQINTLINPGTELTEGNLATGGSGSTTLPVELLYFRAAAMPQGIQVDWASLKEWAFSHYTLERSEDGKNFTPIHVEYVDGESSTLKTYSYQDAQPTFGANYYRLVATDIDGTVEYKGMAVAYYGIKGNVKVYPNPAKGEVFTVNNPGAIEGTWLSIRSITGQEFMKIEMPEKELQLQSSSLPSGIYILKVWNQLEVKQLRLVIQ